MNILVNVFHPDIEASSVNASWVAKLKESGKVTLNMQYANYPDWNIDVQKEQALLSEHDKIVFQHPFLWYSVPPLMKKWLDDVLTYGWAYGEHGHALKNKRSLMAISTGCSAHSYQAGADNKYSMSEFLKPLQQTVELTGMQYLAPYIFHGAVGASQDDISQSADEYLEYILTS